jgi:hypothetical protein
MTSQPPQPLGLAGFGADVRRAVAGYGADWKDGLHAKALASSAFLFFACLAPAIAFGGLMSAETGGQIGAMEMIVATAACGVAYAFFAGGPLVILGGTGPLLVFTAVLYTECGRLGLPFLPTYAWVGLWTGVITIILGLAGTSRWIHYFTRFTDETFAALISLIFIYEAISNILQQFPAKHIEDDSALLSLLLALGTFYVAGALSRLRHRPYLRNRVREALADFGPAIAVLIMTVARTATPDVELEALKIPATFATTTGRPWLVPLGGVPGWVPFAAIGPALLAAMLLYLDQNITARIVNNPSHKLTRGTSYHLDLTIVGLLVAACSMFGLPWLVAATVRSLNHVRSLAELAPTEGDEPPAIASVRENRVSPMLIHLGVAGALLATGLISKIPMAVLYGLFLYMGVASMKNNQFFDRLRLWIVDPAHYPDLPYVQRVPLKYVHAFTVIQLVCLGVLWVVKKSAIGILLPLFIALLVPLRYALGRIIPQEHIKCLDSHESPEELEERQGP